jgi:O-antigen ligase
VYYLGISNSDTTRGLVRYNGLYNDPGTPSYLAVLCLVFASLYKEVQGKKFSDFHKALYYLSWIATIFILYITITKSALLMFIVFLLLWLGVYKKKLFLIFPSVLIGCYISFTNISEVNQRFETEANFIEQGDEESAKSIGTGRVNRWENLFEQFTKDYDLPSKLLGTSHDYAAHNQYLAYLMQIGLLGLSAFILFLFRFLFKTWSLYKKTNDPQIFAGFTICAMYTAYAFTGHPFNYTTLLWYLMIMLGIINVYAKQKSRNTFTIRANENNKFIKPIPAI